MLLVAAGLVRLAVYVQIFGLGSPGSNDGAFALNLGLDLASSFLLIRLVGGVGALLPMLHPWWIYASATPGTHALLVFFTVLAVYGFGTAQVRKDLPSATTIGLAGMGCIEPVLSLIAPTFLLLSWLAKSRKVRWAKELPAPKEPWNFLGLTVGPSALLIALAYLAPEARPALAWLRLPLLPLDTRALDFLAPPLRNTGNGLWGYDYFEPISQLILGGVWLVLGIWGLFRTLGSRPRLEILVLCLLPVLLIGAFLPQRQVLGVLPLLVLSAVWLPQSLSRRWYAVLILPLLLIRIVEANTIDFALVGDAAAYWDMARNLRENGFLGIFEPDARRPPLFMLIVALIQGIFGMRPAAVTWLNVLLDAGTLLLLVRLAKRMFGEKFDDPKPGLILVAITPLWFAMTNLVLTESLTVLLFAGFLEFWTREKRRSIDYCLAGACLGLLILTKSMFALFPAFLVGWIGLESWRRKTLIETLRKPWLWLMTGSAYGIAMFWAIRNFLVLGKLTFMEQTHNVVIMLWCLVRIPEMNWRNPAHIDIIRSGPYFDLIRAGRTVIPPERLAELKAQMLAEVWDFVSQHPVEYVWRMIRKNHELWITYWDNPFPYMVEMPILAPIYIWVFAAPVVILGLLGAAKDYGGDAGSPRSSARSRAAFAVLAMSAYLTLILLPMTVEARYTLAPNLALTLWMGTGVGVLLGRKKKRPLYP